MKPSVAYKAGIFWGISLVPKRQSGGHRPERLAAQVSSAKNPKSPADESLARLSNLGGLCKDNGKKMKTKM